MRTKKLKKEEVEKNPKRTLEDMCIYLRNLQKQVDYEISVFDILFPDPDNKMYSSADVEKHTDRIASLMSAYNTTLNYVNLNYTFKNDNTNEGHGDKA